MPNPARAITNDYKDCQLIRLDPNDPASPLAVTQQGYAPGDPNSRVRLFYLQRDGYWIDEIAQSARPDDEIGQVVYENSADAMRVLSGLFGKPLILQRTVSEADTQAYLSKVQNGTPAELLRQFLARYRAAKNKS